MTDRRSLRKKSLCTCFQGPGRTYQVIRTINQPATGASASGGMFCRQNVSATKVWVDETRFEFKPTQPLVQMCLVIKLSTSVISEDPVGAWGGQQDDESVWLFLCKKKHIFPPGYHQPLQIILKLWPADTQLYVGVIQWYMSNVFPLKKKIRGNESPWFVSLLRKTLKWENNWKGLVLHPVAKLSSDQEKDAHW